MRRLGTGLLITGVAVIAYSFVMVTSVSVRDNAPAAFEDVIPKGMRVDSMGLMKQRQNYLVGGGLLAIIGTVLLVTAAKSGRNSA